MKLIDLFESRTTLAALIDLVHELENLDEARFLEIELDVEELKVNVSDRDDIARNKKLYFNGSIIHSFIFNGDDFINLIEDSDIVLFCKNAKLAAKIIIKDFVSEKFNSYQLTHKGCLWKQESTYLQYDRDVLHKLKVGDIISSDDLTGSVNAILGKTTAVEIIDINRDELIVGTLSVPSQHLHVAASKAPYKLFKIVK